MTAIRFSPDLAARLMRIYGLEIEPKGPDDFFLLLRTESAKHARTRDFLDLVRSGKAVIGRTEFRTKDWIIAKGAKKAFTLCSYDTLMTGVLRGDAEIGSSCPHCGAAMRVRISESRLKGFSPKGTVFFWGTGPEGSPGNPMCDHLHLFPSRQHMNAWIESKEGEEGFSFGLSDTVQRLRERF